MSGYRRWAVSSQADWVGAGLFFAIPLMNVALGTWWLAAITAAVGVVNVRRAVNRQRAERSQL
jgi:hypothetical protein